MLSSYNEIPNFGVYSDQVQTIVQMNLNLVSEKNEALTGSMINNYVKNGMIEKPKDKKYFRDQLAKLIVITYLKEVFSLDEIKKIISTFDSTEELYNNFKRELDNIHISSDENIFKKAIFSVEHKKSVLEDWK